MLYLHSKNNSKSQNETFVRFEIPKPKIDQQMFEGSIGHIYLVFNRTTSLIQTILGS